MSLTKATYSMVKGTPLNVVDYYLPTDPDYTNAFERAIYEAEPTLDSIELYVPPGVYTLSRQLIPRRSLFINGGGLATTRLIFNNVASLNATMKGAISFGILTTLNAYTTNPNNYPTRPNTITAGGADQSQVSNLNITITGTRPAGFDYGIWNAARATLANVQLYACGLKSVAGNLIIGSGVVTGNANTSLYTNVNSLFATEHAFITDGDDSNNITFNRCSAFVPNIIGFYEGSFLGNLYVSCHREGVTANTTHGYKAVNAGGANRSMFLQCYNEGDAVLTNYWDIDTGVAIIGSEGALPESTLGGGKNAYIVPGNLAGYTTNFQFNCAADGDGFTLGSATVAATRMATDGFFVRAGDDSLGAMTRGGDGTYLSRSGVNIMKLEKGAAISDPAGGGTVDTQARTAIAAILARMRAGVPNIAT